MTTKTIQINSDVTGRIKRILQGVEFDGNLTFITELLQNTQRAKATTAHITLEDDKMILADNGFGCADPKNLLTLDFSGFGYGFGEGFSSVYTLLGQVKVKTLDWEASIDVERLASKRTIKLEDLDVPIKESDFYQGFIVELQSDKIRNDLYSIHQEIRKVASTIKEIDFYLNGELLPKVDLLAIPTDAPFFQYVDNHLYEAMLHAEEHTNGEGVQLYYDNRFVMTIYHPVSGLRGNLLIKPNKVNLKAPDRTSVIYDDKRRRLLNQMEKDCHQLLVRILKEGSTEQIEQYAPVIRYHLPVEKYMRYLQIDESIFKNQFEVRQEATEETPYPVYDDESYEDDSSDQDGELFSASYGDANHFEQTGSQLNMDLDTASVPQAVASLSSHATVADLEDEFSTNSGVQTSFEEESATSAIVQTVAVDEPTKQDLRRSQDDSSFSSYVRNTQTERVSKEDLSTVSLANIKRKTNVVWVERSSADEFDSLISQYEYYGLFTFQSPHVLYDEALRHIGITHVGEVESDAIEKRYNVRNIGAKTKKEMRAMELLQRIEHLFGLPNTFYISDIECKMYVNLNEKQIYQQKLGVEGYAQGNTIHLNRKSLHFGKLSSLHLGKDQWGIHDVKFLLANLELIVHELAHRIHFTDDNTINHYEAMLEVQNKVTQYILNSQS